MKHLKGSISSVSLFSKKKDNDLISTCNQHSGAFLFINSENSFLDGAISLFKEEDIESQFKLYLKETDATIDHISIYCDWRTAGNDLARAMKTYGERPPTNLSRI